MPHVLYIASECAPYVKTGGLGDVMGALPKCVARHGDQVSVLLPLYRQIDETWRNRMTFVGAKTLSLSWRKQYAGLYRLQSEGVTYYFIDNKYYFDRDALYGFYDDGERFAFFAKAALDLLPMLDTFPDVLHCNDWQAALVPVYLKAGYQFLSRYRSLRTVFTIHNIEYQGTFDHGMLGDVLGLQELHRSLLDIHGSINYMKGAIVSCDILTTVSPTYAKEILYSYFGRGLEFIIRENEYKLHGILNGIDTELYDPMTDPHLKVNYDIHTMTRKVENKKALSAELGLSFHKDTPMLGMVTRLVHHKGLDLVMGVFDEMMDQDLTMVILGTGDAKYEGWFREKAGQYNGKFSFVTAFSGPLASRIYGGADFFLMPSISEPCGLSQMIALRYGTIPIVRKTGGLADTIQPYSAGDGRGNGVHFQAINAHDMLGAVQRGLEFYKDKILRKQLMTNALSDDHSWKRSAGEYIALYHRLTDG
jgi:starch synthase